MLSDKYPKKYKIDSAAATAGRIKTIMNFLMFRVDPLSSVNALLQFKKIRHCCLPLLHLTNWSDSSRLPNAPGNSGLVESSKV